MWEGIIKYNIIDAKVVLQAVEGLGYRLLNPKPSPTGMLRLYNDGDFQHIINTERDGLDCIDLTEELTNG